MHPSFTSIVQELHALAVREHWDSLAKKCEAALQESPPKCVLLAPADSDATTAISHLSGQTSGAGFRTANLDLIGEDTSIWTSPKLLIALPAGRLIEAAEAQAVARVFELRPAGSYAIIISDADKLQSADGLELAERAAWRLLVQSPPPNPARAQLRDYGVFLWTHKASASFLEERIKSDREGLTRWFLSPAVDLRTVEIHIVDGLLNEAALRVQQSVVAADDDAAALVRKVDGLMTSLADLRERSKRRLEADAEQLVTSVGAALRSGSGALRAELEKTLSALQQSGNKLAPGEAKALVEKKLNEAIMVWGQEVTALVRNQADARKADSDDMLHVVDWSALNEVIAGVGCRDTFPDKLLSSVFGQDSAINTSGLGSASVSDPPSNKRSFGNNLLRIGAPVGAGTGFAVMLAIRIWAAPAVLLAPPVIGAIAGVAATLALTGGQRNRLGPEQISEYCNATVGNFVTSAITHFQSETKLAAASLLRRAVSELNRVEALLNDALRKGGQTCLSDAAVPSRTEFQQLRHRFSELVQSRSGGPNQAAIGPAGERE